MLRLTTQPAPMDDPRHERAEKTDATLKMGPFLQPLSPHDRDVVALYTKTAERHGYTVLVAEGASEVTVTAHRSIAPELSTR